MIKCWYLTLVCVCCLSIPGKGRQKVGANVDSLARYGVNLHYKWVACNPVEQKNFYLLAVLERDAYMRRLLEKDAVLTALYRQYRQQANKPDFDCNNKPLCYTRPMMWDSVNVETAAARLIALYRADAEFRKTIHKHLRESGVFMRWPELKDEDMLASAWKAEVNGINTVIATYTTNKGFRHPEIDSGSYDVRGNNFRRSLEKIYEYYKGRPDTPLFFYPSLKLALHLLAVSRRDEAARHEPLLHDNKSAYRQLPLTDWGKYPYSVILILGEGPDDKQPICKGCMHRCDMGAALYHDRKAPFIIVSGGYVHPFQTPYSEAVEMRKYLVEKCKMPLSAIIIEPQARHTTTNIRNTNRIIYRNQIPASKKVLCVSSRSHIGYILTPFFEERNRSELGYLPYSGLRKVSHTSVAYCPVVESLYWDCGDPLDP